MPTARYALLQSSYWSGFCLIVNFASVYLLAQGLSNAQIGMVIAVASALSTVAQPLVAGVADRSRWPLRLWLVAGGLAIAIVGLALLLPGERGLLVAVNYGLLIGSIQLLQPLVNSVGMAVINLGVKVNFGVARASASLAFALLSLAAGRIVEATSEASLPLMLLLVQLVFVVAAATFVFRRAEGERAWLRRAWKRTIRPRSTGAHGSGSRCCCSVSPSPCRATTWSTGSCSRWSRSTEERPRTWASRS